MQATSDKTASANFTQTAGPTYNWTVVGSVTGDAYGKTGYNPFFQWGRKDAFRSAEYTTAPAANTSLVYSATSVTVGTTIKTPTTQYNHNNSGNGNPYEPYYYNAWNAIATTYSAETTKTNWLETTVKTVYDPCPVGYTVAPANTFIDFNKTSFPEEGAVRTFTNSNEQKIFFPYSGDRRELAGTVAVYGTAGFCWEAISGKATTGRHLNFSSENVYPRYVAGARAYLLSVRPISENVRQH